MRCRRRKGRYWVDERTPWSPSLQSPSHRSRSFSFGSRECSPQSARAWGLHGDARSILGPVRHVVERDLRTELPRREVEMWSGRSTKLLENVGGDVGKRNGLLGHTSEIC
jgi:hypothetical protein